MSAAAIMKPTVAVLPPERVLTMREDRLHDDHLPPEARWHLTLAEARELCGSHEALRARCEALLDVVTSLGHDPGDTGHTRWCLPCREVGDGR
jgi:hypothetical protein